MLAAACLLIGSLAAWAAFSTPDSSTEPIRSGAFNPDSESATRGSEEDSDSGASLRYPPPLFPSAAEKEPGAETTSPQLNRAGSGNQASRDTVSDEPERVRRTSTESIPDDSVVNRTAPPSIPEEP